MHDFSPITVDCPEHGLVPYPFVPSPTIEQDGIWRDGVHHGIQYRPGEQNRHTLEGSLLLACRTHDPLA